MIAFDPRPVGMEARTASMLLLCTSLDRDGSFSAKRMRETEEKREKRSIKIRKQNGYKVRIIFFFFCLFCLLYL